MADLGPEEIMITRWIASGGKRARLGGPVGDQPLSRWCERHAVSPLPSAGQFAISRSAVSIASSSSRVC